MKTTHLIADCGLRIADCKLRISSFRLQMPTAILILVLVIGSQRLSGDTHYVSLSGGHVSPFTSWADAATNIQNAVDVADNGDVVRVTNGVYSLGGGPTPRFTLQNRVVLTNAITLESVNGPAETVIAGLGPRGNNAVRCAYLTNGAQMVGFTLSNGHTRTGGNDYYDESGGAAFLDYGGIVSNCFISQNEANRNGGGVCCYYAGTVADCTVISNSTRYSNGGGVYCYYGGGIYNSTINGNEANYHGGGVCCYYGGVVSGCSIGGNSAAANNGGGIYCYYGGTVNWCTVAENYSHYHGGGIYAYSAGNVNNCMVLRNEARVDGGGIYSLRSGINNCAIIGNFAQDDGGGAFLSRAPVRNCTVAQNTANDLGGGVYSTSYTTNSNNIIYGNTAPVSSNYYSSSSVKFFYCCTTPAHAGAGNITNTPLLAGVNDPHILAASPCIDAGTNAFAVGVDIDNEVRIYDGAVDIGCDEFIPAGITGELSAGIIYEYNNVITGFPLSFWSDIRGKANMFVWSIDTGSGTAYVTNELMITHAWPAVGDYDVILTASNNDGDAASTVTVHVVEAYTNYVSLTGGNVPPYTSWADAATDIQDAIDAVAPGGLTLVETGVYLLSSQINLTRPVTVKAFRGADATIVDGGNAQRGFFVDETNAVLEGFTITNAYTTGTGSDRYGGGVYLNAGTINECTLINNGAQYSGGGMYLNDGVVNGCNLVGNHANSHGGGVYFNTGGALSNCVITANTANDDGGGVYCYDGGAVYNSFVEGNSADDGGGTFLDLNGAVYGSTISGNTGVSGGGVYCRQGGTLYSSIIVENNATDYGGGVYHYRGGTLNNCTIGGNTCPWYGGGVYCYLGGTQRNAIVYFNSALVGGNYHNDGGGMSYEYCCTTPDPGGPGCITGDPLFNAIDGDYSVSYGSPCIDAGSNMAWMAGAKDIAGHDRIIGGTVDMGAYEAECTAGCPGVDITNNNFTVGALVNSCTIAGTNSAGITGTMLWSNALTGAKGTFASATAWEISGITLFPGDNAIYVFGTNVNGDAAGDDVTVTHLKIPPAPKSLYVIADINSDPTPIRAYRINGDGTLTFQAEDSVPEYAGGAVGIAIDTDSETLFITYENSDVIQLIDARTMADLGTTAPPSAVNLAGIVVDQEKQKVYTMDRGTSHLYVYDWDAVSKILTLEGTSYVSLVDCSQAYGIALDEVNDLLYVGDNTTKVKSYNTTNWAKAGEFTLSQTAAGIAIDVKSQCIYTGSGHPSGGSILTKFNLVTSNEISTDVQSTVLGVAVDPALGYVYITTYGTGGPSQDRLLSYSSALVPLWMSDDLGNPTGLCVPGTNVSYNLLNLEVTDDPDPVVTDNDLTYNICYDNAGGTAPALDVTLTDPVPFGTTFLSATGSNSFDGSIVTWYCGTLTGGTPQACVELVVHVNALPGEVIVNEVSIRSLGEVINTVPETTDVVPEPGMVLFEICCLGFVIRHLLRRPGRSRRPDPTLVTSCSN